MRAKVLIDYDNRSDLKGAIGEIVPCPFTVEDPSYVDLTGFTYVKLEGSGLIGMWTSYFEMWTSYFDDLALLYEGEFEVIDDAA